MTTPPPPRATLRPHERIRDPAAFRRAFDRRKTASDSSMVVYAVENGLEYSRLGISVGRKKVKRATARNRLKRLVREAFRLSKADLPRGVDLIVVPRDPKLTFEAARTAFPRLAREAARRLGPRPARPAPPTASRGASRPPDPPKPRR